MKFAPRHVVTMVVAVCAAAVLAPVGVMAATGTLVHITDATFSDRKAQVTQRGGLLVETRPSLPGTFVQFGGGITSSTQSWKLAETVSPTRLALSEMTFLASGGTDGAQHHVDVTAFVQQYASNTPCAPVDTIQTPTGYSRTTLRRVVVYGNVPPMIQLHWQDPALMVPVGTSGLKSCVWVIPASVGPGASVFHAGTGYRF